MYVVIIGAVACALAALALTVVWINGLRYERSVKRLIGEISAAADADRRSVHDRDLESLPEPVKRYLRKALGDAPQTIRTASLQHTGWFRTREDSEDWNSFKGSQYFCVSPPAFVWKARIRIAPLVWLKVLDGYSRSAGFMRVKLFNVLSIIDASNESELNSGALARYLAESVWFPAALLPSQRLTWTPIDERTAQATLKEGSTTVSVRFFFNGDDEIVKGTAERYRRQEDGAYRKVGWSAYYGAYREYGGYWVPSEGRVEWSPPEKDWVYWKGTVVKIEYDARPASGAKS